jgi:hypothetical protein
MPLIGKSMIEILEAIANGIRSAEYGRRTS